MGRRFWWFSARFFRNLLSSSLQEPLFKLHRWKLFTQDGSRMRLRGRRRLSITGRNMYERFGEVELQRNLAYTSERKGISVTFANLARRCIIFVSRRGSSLSSSTNHRTLCLFGGNMGH